MSTRLHKMDINNLALVRAMKIEEFLQLIDNDGILYSLSESVVIRPPKSLTESKVAKVLEKLESDISIPYKEFYSYEEYMEQFGDEYKRTHGIQLNLMGYNMQKNMDKKHQKLHFFEDWLPLRLEYNSVILFSINGLVPDDIEGGAFANNTFSTDKVGIIIALSDIIDKSEFASIVPTDTAVKGTISLPKGSYLLIDEKEYQELSHERKEKIQKIKEKGINCIGFNGTLKEVVDGVLKNSGRYTNESLSLSRHDCGYKESETKDDILKTIDEVASKYHISKEYHRNYAMRETQDYNYIYDYIQNEFFRYLQSKGELHFNYSKLIEYDADQYYDEFAQIIKQYGIEKFHQLVKGFNKSVLELKHKGKFPIPKELIEANENANPISIYEDIIEMEQSREEK